MLTRIVQTTLLWAQEADYSRDTGGGAGQAGGIVAALMGGVFALLWLLVAVVMIIAMWKIFTKAGKPGWAAIVPIYNIVVLLEIVGKPIWWIVLMLIPCVNIIVMIMLALELAKRFGKEVGFAIGMIILPFVFYPILGFGDSKYKG